MGWSTFLTFLVALGAWTTQAQLTERISYRLPTNVIPHKYSLFLHPDLEKGKSEGSVAIDVDVTESTKEITFHAKDIEFLGTTVHRQSKEMKIVNQTEDNPSADFRNLRFADKLKPGRYSIRINFTSSLDGETGFYRTSYVENGRKRYLAATHFEPIQARLAFPCFDEPALKAFFDIRIRRTKKHHAVSNMQLVRTIVTPDYEEDIFRTTKRMSTHLVAFAVSDLGSVSKGAHRIFGQPKAIADGDGAEALGYSVRILHLLELYLGMKYPLPKIDHMELPGIPEGAMENWGLVTYSPGLLLYNKKRNTIAQKQSVMTTMAHQLAHQWFGGLVTPVWWKYAWMNEGFNTLYEYTIPDMVKPALKLRDQFVVDALQTSLKVDYNYVRPMTEDTIDPKRRRPNFDTIAYYKSACVIYMLQNAISENVFRTGLKKYLLDRQYNNVTSADLWRNLQKAADEVKLGLSIPTIMSSWETQGGYPMVSVTRNYKTDSVQLAQKQYSAEPEDDVTWHIPFNYATSSKPNFNETSITGWLTPDGSKPFKVPASEWVLVNKLQTGYYRVNYDKKNWKLLADYLNTDNYQKIHRYSRAQLVDDAFDFACKGVLGFDVALDITNYLHRETEYVSLSALFRHLEEIEVWLPGVPTFQAFEKHIGKSLEKAFELVGVEEGPHANEEKEQLNNLNRLKVVKYACQYGNHKCLSKAMKAVQKIDSVAPSLKGEILCAGLRDAPSDLWEKIYKRSKEEKDQELKRALESALGCSHDPKILAKYLQNENYDPKAFETVYTKRNFGNRFAFDYLLDNFGVIYRTLGHGINHLLSNMARILYTTKHINKFERLAASGLYPKAKLGLEFSYMLGKTNVEKYAAKTNAFGRWIRANLAGM